MGQNHGLTLRKNVNFWTFRTSCFYSLEKLFFVLEYQKRHFPCLFCLKKKFEKWPFLEQNRGLTPLKKCQFFVFLNFIFYSLERRFFVLEYYKRHFAGLYCPKKKVEKWPFLEQNHGLTPLEKGQFFDFLNFLFL